MRLNSDGHRLSGAQIDKFRAALHDAFDRESFVDFLSIQLDKSIDDLTARDTYLHELRNIIRHLDEQDESAELLQGARLWRPRNVALALFAQHFGLMPAPSLTDVFESKIRPLDPELDVMPWCTKLMALAPRVCRIDFPLGISSKLGTGFLVGVHTVMTSFHVMREVFDRKVDPGRVSLRFDYQVLEDGRTFSDGIIYHLPQENWCLDSSPCSPLDGHVQPGNSLPDEHHLDYILLQVEGKPGLEPIGGKVNKQPRPEKRGWVDLSSLPPVPVAGTELFILHHPDGQRLKITLNTTSVQSVNDNCTRILHQTNTANGTSGAPCFTYTWQAIALHQAGDPAAEKHQPAAYNQSIPLATIWKRLAQRDMLRHLGDGQSGMQSHSAPSIDPLPRAAILEQALIPQAPQEDNSSPIYSPEAGKGETPAVPASQSAENDPLPRAAISEQTLILQTLQEDSSSPVHRPELEEEEPSATPTSQSAATPAESDPLPRVAILEQALIPQTLQEDSSSSAHNAEVGERETPATPASQTTATPAESEGEAFSAEQNLKSALDALQEAMALFPSAQTYILPEKFDRARRALETMAQQIAMLKAALDGTPALALTVHEHIGDMHHQLNIVLDQIENYLLPAFYQRSRGNFTRLQAALHKVAWYFSGKE